MDIAPGQPDPLEGYLQEDGQPYEPYLGEDEVAHFAQAPAPAPAGAAFGVAPIEHAAERHVLAMILTSPEAFDVLSEELAADDFGAPAHAALYRAIVTCDATGRPFDPITVADEMRAAGTLDRFGGMAFIENVMTAQLQPDVLHSHAKIVRDRSLRRSLVALSRTIGSGAMDPGQSGVDAVEEAERSVLELGAARVQTEVPTMAQIMAEVSRDMVDARERKVVGHSTGFETLDELCGGLRGGQMVVVAGRPAMGKTVLATQILRHIAQTSGGIVPFFSYEMSTGELGIRFLAAESDVDLGALLRGIIPAGRDRDVAAASERLSESGMLVIDSPPLTIAGVRSECRRLSRRGKITAIGMDYVQLVGGDGNRRGESREQEVASVSRGTKLLAKEFDVPVIAVSQLSRSLESRPNKRPMLSDLRESGSLEQDANLVAFVYRDWVYDKSADPTHAEVIIAKNRQGRTGAVALDWHGPKVRFDKTDRLLDADGPSLPSPGDSSGGGGFGGGGFGGGGFGGGGFGGGGFGGGGFGGGSFGGPL